MKEIILIFGASGSGTTTLGKNLVKIHNYFQIDTDKYLWEKTDPPFRIKRERDKRVELILNDIKKYNKVVITGSMIGWGDSLLKYIDKGFYLYVDREIRLDRIKNREYKKYGSRIEKDGDMYYKHMDFLEYASKYDTAGLEQRSMKSHCKWIKKFPFNIIKINGNKSTEEVLEEIEKYL